MTYWTVIGVDTGATWPKEEVEVRFREHEFILRPETEDYAPSIALVRSDDKNRDEDLSLCRQFMSALAWSEHQPVREEIICGNGGDRPMFVGKSPQWQSISALKYKLDYLPEPTAEKAILALALYRESLNVNSPAYAFLGYFKILNIILKDGASQKKWINDNIGKITDYHAIENIEALKKSQIDLGDHLYHSGRCAVAHAFEGVIVNPDITDDVRRLNQELPVIKALSELAIEQELGVKSQSTFWKEHLYELDGFKKIIPEYVQQKLKQEDGFTIELPISFPPMTIGIRDKPDYEGFVGLSFNVVDAKEGVLVLHGRSDDSLMDVLIGLDFSKGRLRYDVARGVRIKNDRSKRVLSYAISMRQFMIDLLCNGEFYVKNASTGEVLGRADPFVAVNIDLERTIENLETQISSLKVKMEKYETRH